MPGIYTVEMLAMKYGENTHEVRRALTDAGVAISLTDQVDVDAAEKADANIKKWLDDHHKARLAEKEAAGMTDEAKAKWLAEHNAKVQKSLDAAGSWEALVASSSKKEA